MTRLDLLLTMLSEECAEVQQRVSKALRFGLDETQSGDKYNNAERILFEFADVLSIIELLSEEDEFISKLVSRWDETQYMIDKKYRVEKWLRYSKLCGRLT